jgi:hypothetical protein
LSVDIPSKRDPTPHPLKHVFGEKPFVESDSCLPLRAPLVRAGTVTQYVSDDGDDNGDTGDNKDLAERIENCDIATANKRATS